jgi:hypothetical protein
VPGIHALGDCISIDGQSVSRYIEPIGKPKPWSPPSWACPPRLQTTRVPLWVKTTSCCSL